MRAIRIVVTVAVVGIAAGAYLAMATVPSFGPYLAAKRSAAIAVARPEPVQEASRSYEFVLPRAYDDEDGLNIAPGMQEGTVILQLPRWAEESSAWLALGQQVLREWQNWAEPPYSGEGADGQPHFAPRDWGRREQQRAERQGEERYGYMPYGYVPNEDAPYGYGFQTNRRGEERRREYQDDYGDAEDQSYAAPERQQPYAPWLQAPGLRAPETAPLPEGYAQSQRQGPGPRYAPSKNPGSDAASTAAERARQAARDVREAERAAQ